MPKLWTESIATHRRSVGEAILDAAGKLAQQHGLRGVTMSAVAEEAEIGRATLYKYFSDIESILIAWHDREIAGHLQQLKEARDSAEGPEGRLRAVLEGYARLAHGSHPLPDADVAATLHGGSHVVAADKELQSMLRGLVAAAAKTGAVRGDVDPAELATYCLASLSGSRGLRSQAAVTRLVEVTLSGLRAPGRATK